MEKMENDPKKICLDIAGCKVKIVFRKSEWVVVEKKFKEQIVQFYSGFMLKRIPEKADYTIIFYPRKNADMITEKKTSSTYVNFFERTGSNLFSTSYQISLYHFQLILGQILKLFLAKHKGLFLHSSAALNKGKAVLFVGPPGAGKSTTIKLLRDALPIIADDSIILRLEGQKVVVYQTPFYEKEWWVTKKSGRYDLDRIFILKKSAESRMEKIKDKRKLFKLIFTQFWKDRNNENFDASFSKIISKFDNFFYLHFRKDREALVKLFDY